jgi:hypothetical protein
MKVDQTKKFNAAVAMIALERLKFDLTEEQVKKATVIVDQLMQTPLYFESQDDDNASWLDNATVDRIFEMMQEYIQESNTPS